MSSPATLEEADKQIAAWEKIRSDLLAQQEKEELARQNAEKIVRYKSARDTLGGMVASSVKFEALLLPVIDHFAQMQADWNDCRSKVQFPAGSLLNGCPTLRDAICSEIFRMSDDLTRYSLNKEDDGFPGGKAPLLEKDPSKVMPLAKFFEAMVEDMDEQVAIMGG